MKSFIQTSIRVFVIINTILILPAIVGVFFSFYLAIERLWGVIPLFIVLAGMLNAWHLFVNQYLRKSWVYNLVISLLSLILFSIPLFSHDINFFEDGYYLLYFWPGVMTASSVYVLQNFYYYEKAKR